MASVLAAGQVSRFSPAIPSPCGFSLRVSCTSYKAAEKGEINLLLNVGSSMQ